VGATRRPIEERGALCYDEGHVKKAKPSPKSSRHHHKARPAARAPKSAAHRESGKAKKPAPRRPAPAPLPSVRPVDERGRRESLAVAKAAIAAALDKKAIEPVLIDVSGRASYADFIAVVSGRSDRQVDAIAEGVCEALAAHGRRPMGREGARNGRWVLIDFGDVVVHVFYHPLREVFDIESLWIDAPRVKLQVPAEARADAASGRDGMP
jgi:ribosome-associated protein